MANNKTQDNLTKAISTQLPIPTGDEDLDRRLKLLTLAKLERDEQVIQDRLSSMREARKQNAAQLRQRKEIQERNQAACPHLKENGKTNLAGQRDSAGNVLLVCQTCGKDFRISIDGKSDPIPRHLIPDARMVGGPIYGEI